MGDKASIEHEKIKHNNLTFFLQFLLIKKLSRSINVPFFNFLFICYMDTIILLENME